LHKHLRYEVAEVAAMYPVDAMHAASTELQLAA
jgi:hypothetical protein